MGHLDNLAEVCWQSNENNGWHEPRADEFGVVRRASTIENLALIDTEVAEAIEAFRKHGLLTWFEDDGTGDHCKPEGFGFELADIIIRTLELAHLRGIDLDECVEEKLRYNARRADVPVRANTKSI